MQISKAVSTSDIFIKPWWAFAQVSMTTMTTMLSCKSGCSLSARIPDSAPCKPGFYQNHPPDVFPCEFITLALTFFEIINKYSCFKSVIWMLNFSLFPHSLIPQNLQLKDQRYQDILSTHMQYCRAQGAFPAITGGNMHADLKNGWTDRKSVV